MIGEYPNCYARVIEYTCGVHKTGIYPDCEWLPCPDEYLSKTGKFYLLTNFSISNNEKKTFMTVNDSFVMSAK